MWRGWGKSTSGLRPVEPMQITSPSESEASDALDAFASFAARSLARLELQRAPRLLLGVVKAATAMQSSVEFAGLTKQITPVMGPAQNNPASIDGHPEMGAWLRKAAGQHMLVSGDDANTGFIVQQGQQARSNQVAPAVPALPNAMSSARVTPIAIATPVPAEGAVLPVQQEEEEEDEFEQRHK